MLKPLKRHYSPSNQAPGVGTRGTPGVVARYGFAERYGVSVLPFRHPKYLPEPDCRELERGIYDLAQNAGWVSVGIDHDTASFAVATIRRWRQATGQEKYPQAKRLMITADGGGSNGSRLRLWNWNYSCRQTKPDSPLQ